MKKLALLFMSFFAVFLVVSCGGDGKVIIPTDLPTTTITGSGSKSTDLPKTTTTDSGGKPTDTGTKTDDSGTTTIDEKYVFDSFEWADDYSSAKAVYVLEDDSTKMQKFNVKVEVSIQDSTCSETGTKTYSVSYDGHTEQKQTTIEKKNHNYISNVVAPTYESDGYTRYNCLNCGYHYDDAVIPALTHSYAQTFSHDEQYHYHACLDEGYENLKNDMEPHTFSDWITTKNPSTSEDGLKERTCSVCGYKDSQVVPKITTYSITYELDGGTNNAANPSSYTEDMGRIKLQSPEKTGYEFDGWYNNGSSITSIDTSSKINYTLVARWTPATNTLYVVKHYQQNIENDEYTLFEREDFHGTTGAATNAVAKSYEGFNTQAFSQSTIDASGSTVVEIYYDRMTFVVSINSGVPTQGSVNDVSGRYKYGAEVTAIATPNNGYIFTGWYYLDQLVNPNASYTFNVPVSGATLQARFAALTINYKVEHYQQNTDDDEYTLFETDDLSTSSGTLVYVVPKSYFGFDSPTPFQEVVSVDGTTVIKVNYDRVQKILDVENDTSVAGGLVNLTHETIKYGATVELVATANNGYKFAGWFENASQVSDKETYSFTMPSQDVYLTAKWAKATDIEYTVKHYQQNTDDDEYTLNETEKLYGTTAEYTEASPKTYEGLSYKSVEQQLINPDGSTVVEIYYDRNEYQLYVSSNYQAAGTFVDISGFHRFDKKLTLSVNVNPGYIFLGWYEYDSDKLITDKTEYKFNMPATYTHYVSKWELNTNVKYEVQHCQQNIENDEYTLFEKEELIGTAFDVTSAVAKTYEGFDKPFTVTQENINPDGSTVVVINYERKVVGFNVGRNLPSAGSINDAVGDYKFGATIELIATTKQGYTFNGWYNGTNQLTDKETYSFKMPSSSVYYEARWTRNNDTPYKVKYYKQDLNSSVYSFVEEETLKGLTDTHPTLNLKEYEGFEKPNDWTSGAIAGDGSLVVELYYKRLSYNFKVTVNDSKAGTIKYNSTSQYYEAEITLDALTTNIGYQFDGWYDGENEVSTLSSYTFTMPAKALNYVAKWSVKDEFKIFTFTSTTTTATITGCLDQTIVNLVIPEGVTNLEDDVFADYTTIETVSFPSTLKDMGHSAFSGCTSLDNVVIPEGITDLRYTFEGCTSLTTFTLSSTVTSLSYSFKNCIGLVKVVIPKTVTNLSSTFQGCTELKEIELLGAVGISDAFTDYSNPCPIEKATGPASMLSSLPNTVKELYITVGTIFDSKYFSFDPASLEKLVIGETVTEFSGNYISYDKLKNVVLPKSLQSVSAQFTDQALDNIYYNGTTDDWCGVTISSYPIMNGTKNFYFYNSNGNTLYEDNRYDVVNVLEVPGTVETIGIYQFAYLKTLQKVIINSGVTSIGNVAFCGCSRIHDLEFPSTVTSIGYGAFDGCGILYNVYYDGGLDDWVKMSFENEYANPVNACGKGYSPVYIYMLDENGVTEFNNKHYTEAGGEYTIPAGITKIGIYQFAYFKFTKVTIPVEVVQIGGLAFNGCSSLKEVVVYSTGEDLSKNGLGPYVFKDCPIEKAIVPYKVATHYFPNDDLTYLEITDIEGKDVGGNPFDTEISAISLGENIKTLILPEGVTVFNHANSKLKTVVLPKSLKAIRIDVFRDIEDSVDVYYSGTALDWVNVSIGSIVSCPTYKGTLYFYKEDGGFVINGKHYDYADGVEVVEYDNTYTVVKEFQFYGFSSKLRMNYVTTIRTYAFSKVSATTLYLSKNLQTIDSSAFEDATLTIYFGGTQDEWNAITKYTYWNKNATITVNCSDGTINYPLS